MPEGFVERGCWAYGLARTASSQVSKIVESSYQTRAGMHGLRGGTSCFFSICRTRVPLRLNARPMSLSWKPIS